MTTNSSCMSDPSATKVKICWNQYLWFEHTMQVTKALSKTTSEIKGHVEDCCIQLQDDLLFKISNVEQEMSEQLHSMLEEVCE